MDQRTAEEVRLEEDRLHQAPWKRWGPYVSERSWGTVREDYSPYGHAWQYFPHDQARSKAYRWGEDGLAGLCDRYQLLVFALALWNGRDPILKERLFGLTPHETNHGEDVKEYYFYLDSTPTHSYMKYLYKYPQAEYPYGKLIQKSRARGDAEPEYELLDTGVFDEGRYFDVFVEYAKAGPEDVCIRIEVCNRGPEDAAIHVLPHLWFRNTWSWGPQPLAAPSIRVGSATAANVCLVADDSGAEPLRNLLNSYTLGQRYLYADAGGVPLFTDNETNFTRVYGPEAQNRTPYVKDAFHRHIINGEACVNLEQTGTKACVHYANVNVPAGGSVVFHLRLTDQPKPALLADVDRVVAERRGEADAFYAKIHPPEIGEDERRVQRQALAGMLWSKQAYLFDVNTWLEGDDPTRPPAESRKGLRNGHWRHLNSLRVLTMPDKWEYPWFAAWDLAFQCLPLALVDPEFAKEQLWVLLFEQFMHANGQIPAYEWEFSDLNPPVHAWAVWRVYNMDRQRTGRGDRLFLEKCFHKLLINFAWWVNRVDAEGNNVFEGGFLGLDNITVVDRSQKMAPGMTLKQSDATGWMGMFCLNLMRIALELSRENQAYQGLATKFFEHFVYIGAAMRHMGKRDFELWSEGEGFFYDVLRFPDGSFHKFRVRSLVGLIPMYAVDLLSEEELAPFPEFRANVEWFLRNRKEFTRWCVRPMERDGKKSYLLSLMNESQMSRLLARLWDPAEFRSEHGPRSLSKFHQANPYGYMGAEVHYEPAESASKIKGGNSNWRGPVWFPTSFLLIESLRTLAAGYGCSLHVEGAAGEAPVTLGEMARGLAARLVSLFLRDDSGRRPVYGDQRLFQEDANWRDCLLFYEYFQGDTGEGLGASHQTGWTGLVATLIDEWRK
ncbi:MAG TPA: glucosidase [Planctomycetales bacterium]|jgi:hypothetical protein|nr:glucosidase [Planctomycetales bacterium]